MNTWILHQDLGQLLATCKDPEVRALAKTAHERYLYPVDNQVLSPEGELLSQLETNEAMGDERLYAQMLDYALGLTDKAPVPEGAR